MTNTTDNFIFDEEKITKNKHFALGMFGNHHYFGVMIPKEIPTKQKDSEVKLQQVTVQIIVLDDHNFYEITKEFQSKHNVRFSEPLLMERNRWWLKDIEDFITHQGVKDAYKVVEFKELFETVKKIYEKYVYLDDGFYDLHAIWDMGTYFFDCFETYPYIELNGLKGTGKSKVMRISEKITFNGRLFISPTPATVFRFVERNKPTLYIDEAEKLFRKFGNKEDNSDLVELLNAGYTKSGRVPRMEKDEKGKWILKSFDVYCPKMIASIKGMQGALKDRCITEIMIKPPKGDNRGDLEPSDNDKAFFHVRNKLCPFALKNAGGIMLQYNCLPKEFNLSNRDWQLWKPLLTIAKSISDEVYQKLGKFAEEITLTKEEVLEQDSWDFRILESLMTIVGDDLIRITVNQIKEKMSSDLGKMPSNTYIGKFLNRLGLGKYRKRTGGGVFYELNKKIVQTLLVTQGIHTQVTLPTLVTQDEEVKDV